jgi:hypothetical protein
MAFVEVLKLYRDQVNPNADRVVFKATELIKLAAIIYQSSRAKKMSISFIVLIRDPRAIFASQKRIFVPHKGKKMNINPLNTIYQWNYLVMQYFALKDQIAIELIKFEEYIKDPLNGLFKIASVDKISPEVLINSKYYNRIQIGEQAMHTNILKSPIIERIQSWEDELSNIYKELIIYHCYEGMRELNYTNTTAKKSIILLLVWFLYKLDLIQISIKKMLRKIFIKKNIFETLKHL